MMNNNHCMQNNLKQKENDSRQSSWKLLLESRRAIARLWVKVTLEAELPELKTGYGKT